MTALSLEQMQMVEGGGGFWAGFACGVSVGVAVLDPTKLTVLMAVATCGWSLE
jgi:hypothetical protein